MICPLCGREISILQEIPLGGSVSHRMAECGHCEMKYIFQDQWFAWAQTFKGERVVLSENKVKKLEMIR